MRSGQMRSGRTTMNSFYTLSKYLLACAGLMLSACSGLPQDTSGQGAHRAVEVMLYKQTPRSDALGRIVVPVSLNDQGPFYFLLDTGATRSVLSAAAASRLGLTHAPGHDVIVRSVNGRSRVSSVQVDVLTVGDMQFRQQHMPVLSASVLDGLDGILSMDHLRDVRLTADFAQAEVRMTTATEPVRPMDRQALKFSTVSHRLIMVNVRIGKHRVPAVIDTGGARTLGNLPLLKILLAEAGDELTMVHPSRITDATDTALDAWDLPVKRLDMGGVGLDDLPVSFGNFPVFGLWRLDDQPALLIGMDALSRMQSLSIDYRNKELVMAAESKPVNREATHPPLQHR